MTITPIEFVNKWRNAHLKERAAAQEHFIDLCRLVGHPTPAESDPAGERYAFEAGAEKSAGGKGWADVWKRGFFALEYKGKNKDLDKAYQQLLQYRESLQNPPLLIVSDMERIVIHTNFTNTVKKVVTVTLDDILTSQGRQALHDMFHAPQNFKVTQTAEQVTEQAANEFARLAEHLRQWDEDAHAIAHFSIQLLFCLFAEDIDLLPEGLFTRLVERGRTRPAAFNQQLRQLFSAMTTGGFFGEHEIRHFNGGLFDNEATIELDYDGLAILTGIGQLDWSAIEPSIFGTLFTRSLDPSLRAQLGAQYTSREDILLIVEPVLMAPLRREWAEVKQEAFKLAEERDAAKTRRTRDNRQARLQKLIADFAHKLATIRVLDPACGSGNFLYVSLKLLLDLEKEVINFCGEIGIQPFFPQVSPGQLYGIEINEYAHELAQATVWIGFIQWLHDNGYGLPGEPILKPLDNISLMDAILAYDEEGKPIEPEWPEAEIILGNPPFLGGNKMRRDLGSKYVDAVFKLYNGRVPGFADLVCYWFEKARHQIECQYALRAGLLATQAIRGGLNRKVLDRIKTTGDIFFAYSDRNWILDGATVHVAMVGFDIGDEPYRTLNGTNVQSINSALRSGADTTTAQQLIENSDIAYIGDTKKGKFDIPESIAVSMLELPNPSDVSNRDVVKPWINGLDITRRPRHMWIIDFGIDMPLEDAAQYEEPFEYVLQHVKPARDHVRNKREREHWWIHGRPAPDLRSGIANLHRYIATPRVAKHRIFVFISSQTIPDGQVVVIAREDEYLIGILQSSIHEGWARVLGTQLRDAESGFRYSQTMTFETFPFPWPPSQEPTDDPRVQAIAQAARELVEKRDNWLNPPGVTEKELKKRTLTNLYNQRPTWLDLAHKKLDEAVLDAYGWPHDLSDEEILERLLALNLARAAAQEM